jgi:membrane peptidoglycan carboxypeptidase
LQAEITRRYSKDDILELYLNEIYYGNLAYGIEAASETYFAKTANQLTLAEASFLAGLPQSPSVYDIFTNRDITLVRQQQVLVLMFGLSQVNGCIKVSNSDVPICVDEAAAVNAANDIKSRVFNSPNIDTRYPHWVNFVRSQLEEQYDAQTIYRSGFIVYTTLSPTLQDEAQRLVTEQVSLLADKNAHNGALVAIKPSTGEILAMVGSPDFNNVAISGQINMADSPTRQPGSSIKPINYVAAFEKGLDPLHVDLGCAQRISTFG